MMNQKGMELVSGTYSISLHSLLCPVRKITQYPKILSTPTLARIVCAQEKIAIVRQKEVS